MTFEIEYDSQPEKFLKKQEKLVAKRVVDKIDEVLPNCPVPHNAKSLIGKHNCFRIRVGDWRVLYRIDYQNNQIVVFKIDERSKVYG